MLLIAHRGNIIGPKPDMENKPRYIRKAINLGFDVKVDVWSGHDGKLLLGHDEGLYEVPDDLLQTNRIWWHAKDVGALRILGDIVHHANAFYNNQAEFITVTSCGHVYTWNYVPVAGTIWGGATIKRCPHRIEDGPEQMCGEVAGICSDYVGHIKTR